MIARLTLRTVALGYLAALLLVPVSMILWKTFAGGLDPVLDALTDPAAVAALKLTLLIAAIAVPLNTVFGILCALTIVRYRFPGKWLLGPVLDLPFAVSPVVVGFTLILVYGQQG